MAPSNRLTILAVINIREQAAAGRSDVELAREHGVTTSCIGLIRTGKRHARVGGPRTYLAGERRVAAFGSSS